jgi:hypothetical protein
MIDENRESLNRLIFILEKESIAHYRPFEESKPGPPSHKSDSLFQDSNKTDGALKGLFSVL